jgi:D-alanyl-D-alanine carboxypeptidase
MRTVAVICLLLLSGTAFCQDEKLQLLLDSLRVAGNYPGLSIAIIKKDNTIINLTSGFNDKEKKIPLKTSDRLMQGSVGKTYASAIALRLVKEGRLNLDEKVSAYLGKYSWYSKIPNAADITVRMLMNHTSGVMRYEFKEQFLKDLTNNPDKVWKPEDLLQYVLEEKTSFAAGEGWEYSDTNYILLGLIIEAITGKKYYALVTDQLLKPFALFNTHPSNSRELKGLAQGYAGVKNEFGGKDKVIGGDGKFIINPQFEWTGGGIYSSTSDLAKWGKLLYENKVVDTALLFSNAVAAKLGRDTKYAMGVIIRTTPMGTSYGHSGFFPGYMTELAYFPSKQLCIAVQCNSSDFSNLKIGLQRILLALAAAADK